MTFVIHEDSFRYPPWLKFVLVMTVVFLLVLGYLFYMDAYQKDIFPREPEKESQKAAWVIFGAAAFTLLLFWAVLPRKIYIFQDKIQIKLGLFSMNIPFESIKSVKEARGIPFWNTTSFVTTFNSQVEVLRNKGMKVRFSPSNRDFFLENFNRVFRDWQHTRLT